MRYVVIVALLLLTGCDGDTYTLYRSSTAAVGLRIHIATFDAAEKAEYNRENCELAQRLFREQPGVSVQYWCEKGRFKK
jgi:hypothetical protein